MILNTQLPYDNYKQNLFISGVGARKVPENVVDVIKDLVFYLNNNFDFVWRSGGADGCDLAFEYNAKYKEIFLPWKEFNKNLSSLYLDNFSKQRLNAAQQILSEIRNIKSMEVSTRKFHTRNVFQVFGQDLETPSLCVICYTDDGAEHHTDVTMKTGGTGTAIKLASLYDIPVYNLKNNDSIDRLMEYLRMYKY